jgi:uncharacterized repeat protein (TIGR03803 family)
MRCRYFLTKLVVPLFVSLTAVIPSGAQTSKFKVVHAFTSRTDGQVPQAGLVLDAQGNLYGTTEYGGTYGNGTVFKVDTAGNETILHSFNWRTDGGYPFGRVILDSARNLYGTTSQGGPSGSGTVFELNANGKEAILHAFAASSTDGSFPIAGLVRDPAGNLYGTTSAGGSSGWGVVFRVDSTGVETVLHSFAGFPDGQLPWAGLTLDTQGNLYGVTINGGTRGDGALFGLNTAGVEAVIASFTILTGDSPTGTLMEDDLGNLYGTTAYNGAYSRGTVFKFDTATGVETTLYNFGAGGNNDGATPAGGLVRDKAGNLYGTTQVGGAKRYGTVFKLDPTGKETILHSFTGGSDGSVPEGSLAMDQGGNLYGTTSYGGDLTCQGAAGCGTVFKIAP